MPAGKYKHEVLEVVARDTLECHLPKVAVALMLTLASGIVDIVGYLGVFHLFTAHLTGTTVQLGHSVVNRTWSDAVPAVIIVFSFVIGSLFGPSSGLARVMTRWDRRLQPVIRPVFDVLGPLSCHGDAGLYRAYVRLIVADAVIATVCYLARVAS